MTYDELVSEKIEDALLKIVESDGDGSLTGELVDAIAKAIPPLTLKTDDGRFVRVTMGYRWYRIEDPS
jgi:hypothetical protein